MNPDTMNQPSQPGGVPPVGSPAPMTPMPEKKGMGGVIALVIIVLALLAGGYFLMEKMAPQAMVETKTPVTNTEPQASAVDPNTIQGTGTSVTDIEKDLNATDLNSISADLNAI